VSSAKAADLRRFLSRHTKTNGIDADTLARLALFDRAGLRLLGLPGAERAALDRRVRATDRLTREASEHKVRIRDLVRQLMPMTPLGADLGAADLAVLERWADPNLLVKAGAKRVTAVIAKASRNQQGADRAGEWMAAAEAAIELYAAHPAVAFSDLAAEVATEARLLRVIGTELATHAGERETAYRWVDPAGLARSLPGLAGPSRARSGSSNIRKTASPMVLISRSPGASEPRVRVSNRSARSTASSSPWASLRAVNPARSTNAKVASNGPSARPFVTSRRARR